MKTFHDPEAFTRVRRLPPQVFAAVGRQRDEARSRGLDVVDLSSAHAGSKPPEAVVEALRGALSDRRYRRAVDPRGLLELRRSAAAWFERRHGIAVDPEREIIVTAGAKDGLAQAMLALLQEGEGVLAPAPAHPTLLFAAVLAGGNTIPVPVGPGID